MWAVLNNHPTHLSNSNALQPGNYDLGLVLQGEKSQQPVTTGELLAIGSLPGSSSCKGPVLVITGENVNDVLFCGGNCFSQLMDSKNPNILEGDAMAFPSASAFQSYIQPNTGHGLNFHYNATAGYRVIQHLHSPPLFFASN